MNPNAAEFLEAYTLVYMKGDLIFPRGTQCRELCDYAMVFDMSHSTLSNFRARNLNLAYAKQEWLWYLRGDRYDDSIEQYASMWKKIRQHDGGYHSNYGQYIFPTQYQFVVDELGRDQWSRRASISILKAEHLYATNSDVVCTYGINFRIRNGKLDMTVFMRSNDLIFGTTNDVFCFTMLYRMVFVELLAFYPELLHGSYKHIANSLHIYERHYGMAETLINEGTAAFTDIEMPWPTAKSLKWLKAHREVVGTAYKGGSSDEFTEWLCTP